MSDSAAYYYRFSNYYLEQILRATDGNLSEGISIGGWKISCLCFTDDIDLIVLSHKKMQKLLERVAVEANTLGQKILLEETDNGDM